MTAAFATVGLDPLGDLARLVRCLNVGQRHRRPRVSQLFRYPAPIPRLPPVTNATQRDRINRMIMDLIRSREVLDEVIDTASHSATPGPA
ncbi:hypothetical protein [Nonomuraea jabiensis]|uniref:Uncharacterized protein n=1 Tax=Nonomuraea jabiensis TaxID=882448 RepID=A0A7W9LEW6_9ACTN|nr:hypothetical protein [Nonomuraea jabiensis]MBB5781302.1 hypothetical protein [Nonomuraea jabiensis]